MKWYLQNTEIEGSIIDTYLEQDQVTQKAKSAPTIVAKLIKLQHTNTNIYRDTKNFYFTNLYCNKPTNQKTKCHLPLYKLTLWQADLFATLP